MLCIHQNPLTTSRQPDKQYNTFPTKRIMIPARPGGPDRPMHRGRAQLCARGHQESQCRKRKVQGREHRSRTIFWDGHGGNGKRLNGLSCRQRSFGPFQKRKRPQNPFRVLFFFVMHSPGTPEQTGNTPITRVDDTRISQMCRPEALTCKDWRAMQPTLFILISPLLPLPH